MKRTCCRCGYEVVEENDLDYPFYCPVCDENLYAFETNIAEETLDKSNLM